jgi:predicted nucleic acid-binding protein
MNDSVFLDTNIFVYLYSEDESEKQIVTLNILEQTRCITSTQVLNEFCSVCLRKLGIPNSAVQQSIKEITENCELCYIDVTIIQKALEVNKKYGYTYYDCLILASAIFNNCKCLYSEDMQHNQIIEDKLKIINPFL